MMMPYLVLCCDCVGSNNITIPRDTAFRPGFATGFQPNLKVLSKHLLEVLEEKHEIPQL
jgi:hypothetical protein